MVNKYGCKVRPYEANIKLRQGGENKIEYFYSLKSFQKDTAVPESEPCRVLDIQDPADYRGELAYHKTSVQTEPQVWIVNGKIERADGNFAGGFYFNKIKNSGIIVGSCPLGSADMERVKAARATCVMNI
jgi:hypothetical protein